MFDAKHLSNLVGSFPLIIYFHRHKLVSPSFTPKVRAPQYTTYLDDDWNSQPSQIDERFYVKIIRCHHQLKKHAFINIHSHKMSVPWLDYFLYFHGMEGCGDGCHFYRFHIYWAMSYIVSKTSIRRTIEINSTMLNLLMMTAKIYNLFQNGTPDVSAGKLHRTIIIIIFFDHICYNIWQFGYVTAFVGCIFLANLSFGVF